MSISELRSRVPWVVVVMFVLWVRPSYTFYIACMVPSVHADNSDSNSNDGGKLKEFFQVTTADIASSV